MPAQSASRESIRPNANTDRICQSFRTQLALDQGPSSRAQPDILAALDRLAHERPWPPPQPPAREPREQCSRQWRSRSVAGRFHAGSWNRVSRRPRNDDKRPPSPERSTASSPFEVSRPSSKNRAGGQASTTSAPLARRHGPPHFAADRLGGAAQAASARLGVRQSTSGSSA